MAEAKDEQKLAEEAKVAEVAERVEFMATYSADADSPWLLRAAKLLRRWGIDLT